MPAPAPTSRRLSPSHLARPWRGRAAPAAARAAAVIKVIGVVGDDDLFGATVCLLLLLLLEVLLPREQGLSVALALEGRVRTEGEVAGLNGINFTYQVILP